MGVTKLRMALLNARGPQYMIAARAGITPSRLSEYALGHRSIPAHHLISLAEVLKTNPANLVGEADDVDLGV